jgi:hypothetical protein
MKAMSKKEKKKPQAQAPPVQTPVQEDKSNFLTLFSRLDSKEKHRILAYLFWLLGIFIIIFFYRVA